jgi:sulfonate dioxygenase
MRREPLDTAHPVVRRHPVTGEEALYVNPQFTRSIVGLKKEESGMVASNFSSQPWLTYLRLDNLLNFLYDHIAKAGDNQARIKWSPYSIVIWDNRVTCHVFHFVVPPPILAADCSLLDRNVRLYSPQGRPTWSACDGPS